MRIGVITTSFPRFDGDHAGLFVLELCRALAARGHVLDVVAPEPADGSRPSWPGITLHWARYAWPRAAQRLAYGAGIPDNIRYSPASALLAPALVIALLGKVVELQRDWDALLSHWLIPSGLLGAAAPSTPRRKFVPSRRTIRPHFALAHSADVWLLERLPAPLGAGLARHIIGKTSTTAAVSPPLLETLARLAPSQRRRLTLLPIGPDEADLVEPSERRRLQARLRGAGFHGDSLRLAVIARLVPIKGVDVLLDALAATKLRSVELVIAGDGPLRAELEARAEALGLRACFLGAISPGMRAALLEAADLLVVPSRVLADGRSEGTPQVAVEALAAGVPVIASDVGGLRWALGDAGLLVPPDDAASLAEAIAHLDDDREHLRRLTDRARARAADFGWSKAATRIEAALSSNRASPLNLSYTRPPKP